MKKPRRSKSRSVKPKEIYNELVVDEVVYQTRLNKMYNTRTAYTPADPNMIKSFMPGNIQEVFVNEGDQVAEGDRLLILEAMKMKNVIIAPHDGQVQRICVQAGDRVPKNHILIELA